MHPDIRFNQYPFPFLEVDLKRYESSGHFKKTAFIKSHSSRFFPHRQWGAHGHRGRTYFDNTGTQASMEVNPWILREAILASFPDIVGH